MRFRLAFALFVSSLLLASPAPCDGGDAAAAEVLFREGRAAAEAGDHARACEKFHESHRLDPAPGTMLNIADCEEKLGHLATAWTFYRAVMQKLPASDERAALAKQRAQELEPKLPRLTLTLSPGAPEGTRVVRDGVELKSASLGTALPVDPGQHVIEVSAPGRAVRRYELSLAVGERAEQRLEPGAALEDPVGDDASIDGSASTSSGSSTRTLGYVIGGVGIAGIAVGAVTGFMVLDKKSIVDENCDADKRCNAEGADAADSGRTLGTISGVSFALGAAALAVGAYFVLSGGGSERPTTALGVGPGGVSLRHTF